MNLISKHSMSCNRVAEMISRLVTGIFLCCWLGLNPLSQADDLRFQSDNRSTEVRPPVLDELPPLWRPQAVAYSELSGQPILAARKLDEIIELVGNQASIVGKVASVYIPEGGNIVILNFGRDFRNCFKVVIDRRDYVRWGTEDARVIADLYEDQNLVVDGLIVLYKEKPQIAATLPNQIRIVRQP
jgi:hypothetical protein